MPNCPIYLLPVPKSIGNPRRPHARRDRGWAENSLFFGADPSRRVFSDGKRWIFPTTDKAVWSEQYDRHARSSEDLVT